jgi:DNA-binding transcriptional MocR family regulator
LIDWTEHYATRARRMAASEIRELLKLVDQPDIISFAGGIPDPKLFPMEELSAAFQRVLAADGIGSGALQYAVSEGHKPLRMWLAEYMTSMGATCGPDNIVITSGSQQALDFLGKLFISPGDTVQVAWPTYLGALQAFNCYEPVYEALPFGNSTEGPVASTSEKRAPKVAYCMPEFQNPTGTSLTLDERNAFLDIAEAGDFPIIEDTAYERLRYDGERLPSLLALDIARCGSIDKSRVMYSGTFSKTLAPGLRIGWIAAAQPVVQKLVLIKQASDLHVSTLTQAVVYEMARDVLDTHLERIVPVYRGRRDAMLAALRREMPKGVSWTEPQGGMFTWLTLPEHMDGAELLARCIRDARVAFVPGGAFFADRGKRNYLRLSFSLANEEKIAEGVQRLAQMIKGYEPAELVNVV